MRMPEHEKGKDPQPYGWRQEGGSNGLDIGSDIIGRLEGMPEIRMELVVPLRRAIREDRYYVPEEWVAECMINRRFADFLL